MCHELNIEQGGGYLLHSLLMFLVDLYLCNAQSVHPSMFHVYNNMSYTGEARHQQL